MALGQPAAKAIKQSTALTPLRARRDQQVTATLPVASCVADHDGLQPCVRLPAADLERMLAPAPEREIDLS